MHVGDLPDSFSNPKGIAEYAAGQIVRIPFEIGNIPNIRHVRMQAQEHSEEGIDMGGDTVFVMPSNTMSPNLEKFNILTTVLSVTRRILASDLDQPHEPNNSKAAK